MHKAIRHQTVIEGIDAISIRSDRTFPRHTHDEFGFGYIADGGQDSWSGRGLVEAQSGDVISVNPAELHDGIGRKGCPRYWRMLYLSPAALSKLTDIPIGAAEFSLPVIQSRATSRLVINALAAMHAERADRDHVEQQMILALDVLLHRNGAQTRAARSSCSRQVQLVLDMIRQHYDASLSLNDFAMATDTSRYQILRMFSRELGTTPHAYLTQHRVKRAKRMILKGSSLADVASACGFSDQSHLTRSFARQMGVTPGRFSFRRCA